MMMLNLASTMQVQLRMLERGDRSNFTEHLKVPHVELNGKTLGVIGVGNIGKQVIRVGQALGMKVIACNRSPREDEENLHFTTFEEVLKESDFVSLHCPLTDATRHMINEDTLKLMKPEAFLINTSRGGLVDEQALIRALSEKRIAGAGLDVQEQEPPVDDNPLYDMENVILTPHMGWKGYETRLRLVSVIEKDIKGFFGGSPVNVVS
jgi:glycerate dehydrogenase